MDRHLNRRSMIKAGVGTAAATAAVASKRSSVFAVPNIVKQTGSTVEITYWGSYASTLGDTEQALVDAFNASQTGVRVNRQYQGSYEETAQKLAAALGGGEVPDVTLLSEVNWFRFYLAQALAPMDDFIAATNYDTADVIESLLVEGQRQGRQYWLPFARSTPLFYFNRDAFAEAGLDGPPRTWSEFAEIAPSLVDEGQQRSAFAHHTAADYLAWYSQGMTWAFGGFYSEPDFNIRINEPPVVALGEYLRQSVEAGWATNPDDVGEDFVNGLTAAMLDSTGGIKATIEEAKSTGFEVGTAFLLEEEGFGCTTGGAGLSIMAAAPPERQEAAFQFITYCTSTEVTSQWSQNTGYMPMRTSAVQSPAMQEFFAANPNFKTAVDQLPLTRPQDAARRLIPGGDLIIGAALERITIGGEDPQQVLDAVAVELTEAAAPIVQQLQALGETAPATPAAFF
ncbi:MAG: Glycerol-3-phosphate ABC transporter, substrate-binding protein UgpB [uncultured Thermomicrobiales bacterium]|uniref:Glycerol-3-phosphate ABC transporter, substrate-binding protein UgpB n=1 Tax=uncultured Thermomicrobiales bacterium TaxID=1645740 RepID=A0A6J4UGP2_9BACT|nr:MAG: Glycerol-3-phosphate ABC transporter, substrate-binding protein UgpB [uncultured Thermomicrobiales bacterium]